MARARPLRYAFSMSLKAIIELLQRHDLFAGVDAVRLEVLAFTAERPSFEAGDTLFEAGEEAHEAYLILEGQAVMLAHEYKGRALEGRECCALVRPALQGQ